ncbi:hypothetical protein [Maribacter sp. HTCC2170]|uniref:hypothetical protein n=1 Tax=Maribacter sp. (strain HTCC2170 / KCCM 42371) TaxID=313603 RepID=UPI00006BD497|nr:hypothetical protein [Maribacter sp. HTCC2170]EAR02918.1 hypothetical protein FB2170_06505 [Maribacter sp. HTCC2170]
MKPKDLIFVLLCITFVVKGQISRDQILGDVQIFPDERTKLVINTNILLAGEPLQYKIYNHTDSNTSSTLSKVAYVSLRGVNDSVIFEHKLRLKKGMSQGSFFIPTGLETGIYQLLSYTNFSLNNLENGITPKTIYIINPYVKGNVHLKNEIDSAQRVRIFPSTASDVLPRPEARYFSLKTDKSIYALREEVNLTVENLNDQEGSGNYALSVRRLDPIQVSEPHAETEKYSIRGRNLFYLPELRGELIFGRVLSVDGEKPIENQVVAFTVPGKDYIFKMAKTNLQGRFFISIDQSYETAKSIMQVVGPDKEQYKIVLEDATFDSTELKSTYDLQLNPEIKDWLQERSIQLQIHNAYFNEESIVVSKGESGDRFYSNIGRDYFLDDYTRFPSIRETMVEVVGFARIRRKNGKEAFEVFDPYNPYKKGPFSSNDPLLLVDGILVQDHDEVLGNSAHDLERIHVFPGPYRYGPEVFWGIIDIISKNGDFVPQLSGEYITEFELEGPMLYKRYSSPDYSTKALQRIPDYRTQLFWGPNVRLDSKKLTQHFYVSDVPGTYRILLEGYSDEGSYIMEEHFFEVK